MNPSKQVWIKSSQWLLLLLCVKFYLYQIIEDTMRQIFSPAPTMLRPLFDVPHLRFVIDAMCAGNSPALVWVDNPDVPRSAFIWDKTHCLYLGGEADNKAFYDSLRLFLTQTLLPGARDRDIGIFKVYT